MVGNRVGSASVVDGVPTKQASQHKAEPVARLGFCVSRPCVCFLHRHTPENDTARISMPNDPSPFENLLGHRFEPGSCLVLESRTHRVSQTISISSDSSSVKSIHVSLFNLSTKMNRITGVLIFVTILLVLAPSSSTAFKAEVIPGNKVGIEGQDDTPAANPSLVVEPLSTPAPEATSGKGWYLLLPPVNEQNGLLIIQAPLAQWEEYGGYDNAKDCDTALDQAIATPDAQTQKLKDKTSNQVSSV